MKGKKTAGIFFLTIIFVQMMYFPGLLVDYYVNTGNYLENCVNKERPELHCNGHCQLMTRMNLVTDQVPEALPVQNESYNFQVFYAVANAVECPSTGYVSNKVLLGSYSDLYHYLPEVSIFHPPLLS